MRSRGDLDEAIPRNLSSYGQTGSGARDHPLARMLLLDAGRQLLITFQERRR
jgi:hypothetical protein